MSQQQPPHNNNNYPSPHSGKIKKKSSRRRSVTQSQINHATQNLPNTPHMSGPKKRKSHKKIPKSDSLKKSRRHRSRSDVHTLNAHNKSKSNYTKDAIEDIGLGAAYKKDDIVYTKDTEAKMCVIKTIRNMNGLQYGIIIPPESVIRYIKSAKIVKKIQPESVISHIDTITKGYEDASGDLLKSQQQIKVLTQQCENEKEKFRKLKHRYSEQNSVVQSERKEKEKSKLECTKLKREIEEKNKDFIKLKRSTGEDHTYKKQMTDLNKQIKNLNRTIMEQKKVMNKQKTELSQTKARQNRNKLDDVNETKAMTKLKREKAKADRTIKELRQELQFEKNRSSRIKTENDRGARMQRMRSEHNLEQLSVQQRKLEQKLKKLRNKESSMEKMEKSLAHQRKDWEMDQNKLSIQQQQDLADKEKILNRKRRQEMAEIEKRRQALMRQQKLLEMNKKWDGSKKKGAKGERENKTRRHQRLREQKTKIIIHKKYLCREYMDTCIKWRKRKDNIEGNNKRLKDLEEKLKLKYKRLQKLDEHKRISKGKSKKEAPNKNDLKEYLDVSIPLDELNDEYGSILLDIHPDGQNIKRMPGEILRQQHEIERLNTEIDELQNELTKHKIDRRLQNKLSKIEDGFTDMGLTMALDMDEMEEDVPGEHEEKEEKIPNAYKAEFSGLYRKVANLEENREEILGELKMLINKIGSDINARESGVNSEELTRLEFVPETQRLCDEYQTLESALKEDEKESMHMETPRQKRPSRHRRMSNVTDGSIDTSDIDSDSSSVMEDSDEFEDGTPKGSDAWNGNQRIAMGHKNKIDLSQTQQTLDDLTDKSRTHLTELKEKDSEYKLVKLKMSAIKRDLMQCQGLLEVIEEEDKKWGDTEVSEDMRAPKESLRVFNDLMETVGSELENATMSLSKDDMRVTELMQQLQRLQTAIADRKLKRVQDKFEEIKTGTEVIPPPNVLELHDLRKKINALYERAVNDNGWLENSMKTIEKNKRKSKKLGNRVEHLSPSIHKFARRPQTKIMEFMMEYNYDLGEIAHTLQDTQSKLDKFAKKNQDIRMEQGIEVSKEFTQQSTVLEEYKKTINILQERHKGIMFETMENDKIVTESGPVYELEKIMVEIAALLSKCTEKIEDNNLNLRSQRLGCFVCLEEINNTRDEIIDTVQIPIPSKPNIEDLNESDNDEKDSDESEESDTGANVQAHLKLAKLRKENKRKFKNKYVKKLANLTTFDDTTKIYMALNRIRATLGSVSPLHYAVISDQWLKPKILGVNRELSKLLKNYQNFQPIKTDISIDDEVSNYCIQLVQDLAADYHKVNELESNTFVITENMNIISDKLEAFAALNEADLRCIELKHLQEMYESFCDKNLPQPLPLYSDDNEIMDMDRVTSTKKKDYKHKIAQKYVGLNDDDNEENIETLQNMIRDIECELFNERAAVMPYAFNLIYQNGIIFNAFPGDFSKAREYKYAQSDMTDDIFGIDSDELLINAKEFADMNRRAQIALIKELMVLEWQYTEWINNREDYVTQKMLWSAEALYYKRLFVIPLSDFHLEKHRQDMLLEEGMTGDFRRYRHGLYDTEYRERREKDELEFKEQMMRMKMNAAQEESESKDALKSMHLHNRYKENAPDMLGDGGMRVGKIGDKDSEAKECENENVYSEQRMMIGNRDRNGNGGSDNEFENLTSKMNKEHELGYGDSINDEMLDAEISHIKGKKLAKNENAVTETKRPKESGVMQEIIVKTEDSSYESSEIEYLSMDSEHGSQKAKKLKESQNKPETEEKTGAHGIGMDIEIGNGAIEPIIRDLETADFENITISPKHEMLVSHPMVTEYISTQLEQKWNEEQKKRELLADERLSNLHEIPGSTTDLESEMDTDTDEDEDSEDNTTDEEEEYILDKLREILGGHIEPVSDGDGSSSESMNEIDSLLGQIKNLCQDVDEYNNKYISTDFRNKKLQNEIERTEHQLSDLENQHDLLKQEYLKLREENDTLMDKCRKLQRNNGAYNNRQTPGFGVTPGYESESDGFEEKDVLAQLQDDLLQLRQDIHDSDKPAKSEYKDCKLRLESMCEPLNDLANDFNSDALKAAHSKLHKSCTDIHNLKKARVFEHGQLANIVESNIDDIDDLMHELALLKKAKKMPNQAHANDGSNGGMNGGGNAESDLYKYPELILSNNDGNDNSKSEPGKDSHTYERDDEKDKWKSTPGQIIEFEAEFPRVTKIEIDGNWFNKKPRAVIEWKGKEFKRKMPDFKWLWRMLMLNASIERVVPDYPSEIPESLWPEGYLRRRKRELNLFLMQCHSLPWIKKYKVYSDIFLEQNQKEWKRKRNGHDQDIIDRLKNKEETYDPHKDCIVSSERRDGTDETINNGNYALNTDDLQNENDRNYPL